MHEGEEPVMDAERTKRRAQRSRKSDEKLLRAFAGALMGLIGQLVCDDSTKPAGAYDTVRAAIDRARAEVPILISRVQTREGARRRSTRAERHADLYGPHKS